MDDHNYRFQSLILKSATMLLLIVLGLYSVKTALSDCTIFSRVNCRAQNGEISSVKIDIARLEEQIDQLLKSNSSLECPQLEVANTNTAKAPKIDSSLWEKGDLEVLTGCWSLDWDYSMRRVKTGEIIGVESWSVCFKSGSESGSQTLIFDDGTSCAQKPIRGDFKTSNGQSKLYLDDITNLECTGSTLVYQRRMECELVKSDEYAMCAESQLNPDGSWTELGASTVRLSRSKN
jgi:hypothetical protein